MKKRVIMLALMAALVLSFGASAWADSEFKYFKIESFDVPDAVYDAKPGNEVTVKFNIIARAYKGTGNNNDQQPTGTFPYANLLKWTVGDASWDHPSEVFNITAVEVTNNGDKASSKKNTTEYLYDVKTLSDVGEAFLTYNLSIEVTGKVIKAGDLQVKASLYDVGGREKVTVSNQKDAKATSGANKESASIPTKEGWDYAHDPANPDATEAWDGKDPIFDEGAPGDNSVANAKAKVTTKSVDPFKSGTAKSEKITITGPVTEVNVYVSAKDAIKLGWLDKGATDHIQLTKDNIKEYSIPFRITDIDFSKNQNKLTGADKREDKKGAKQDKEQAKKMTTTLTLAFNGGYFSYKGFPITVAARNEEMGDKWATKTFKINVDPATETPVWWFWDTHDETQRKSTTRAVTNSGTIKLSDYKDVGDNVKFSITDGSGTLTEESDKDTYTVVVANGMTEANVTVSYDVLVSNVPYKHIIDPKKNKADKNIEIPVPLTGGDDDETKGIVESYTYYIDGGKGYGSFVITQKGADVDKNGVSADITQPTFNYRGEVETEGSVSFSGQLKKLDKESKTGVTLTVTNPSTKKKAAAKFSIVGKLPATFDVNKYPVSDDLGSKWFTTKYVEAGKVPSVKVKANGTKTINYYASLSALNDVGLSFDTKKGAVVALDKSKKNLITPTATYNSDDEPEFDPIYLEIEADNDVGKDSVMTRVGITGAKPKITTKKVEFKKAEHVNGVYKEIVVNAGKSAPSATDFNSNIVVTLENEDDTTLEDLGLKLATWRDLPHMVSNDGEAINDGDKILDSGDKEVFTLYLQDEEGNKTVLSAATYTDKDTNGNTIAKLTGDAVKDKTVYLSKGLHDDGNGDITKRNKGYILVTDAEQMKEGTSGKVQLNLIAENVGAEAKGKVTLVVEAIPDETEDESSARINKTVAEDKAAKNSKNGKGGNSGTGYGVDGYKSDAEDEAEVEAVVTIGEARTAADLTAAQNAFLAEKGYIVIAVLPEISADGEGQQDIPADLDEDAPEGKEMIYIPFPKDADESEDDNIVDFYDEAGAPVEGVPASHKIIASPWLREGVTYAPVIAIEAE